MNVKNVKNVKEMKKKQLMIEQKNKKIGQITPLRNYLMAHVMPTLTKALIGMIS